MPDDDLPNSRSHQMYPRLSETAIARIQRFGSPRRFAAGDYLFKAGEPGPGMFVVRDGRVTITQRDGMGHVTPIARQGGAGQFLAEVGRSARTRRRRPWCISTWPGALEFNRKQRGAKDVPPR